ncbi:mandelate racemase/muconate lactonizing enzyme family protein [Marinitenerispora sediminis]|uniref:Racemase n=1 Tax=Marinitenerispora sediminis TaxID=1931232 RepID=A0A368SY67_9ACTN|nr:mandelate racemase/muconate lactonizing enzyme family protein [Marinitenerispora sediminis]RCV48695.1 racemase [Marinitenerispora sediminis]RCV48800.1 racemase [Marinitenerispora sediminis]RCV50814.1 racemase [Marinitenerispora sediminis]
MLITDLSASAYRLPLARAWDGGVDRNDIVVVRLRTDTGAVGTGFAWTPKIGAGAVLALLRDDCPEALLGRPAVPGPRWSDLRHHLREAGTTGLTALAAAAVDIALWDLAGKAAGRPLVDLVGRRRDRVPAYGSGVNLDYDLPDLLDQVRGWLAAGHRAVKIKVGSPEVERDVERVAEVRRLIGPHRRLMLDANQRWDVPAAVRALRALAPFEPDWIEEPLPADDLAGHLRLRAATPVPFAVGENLRSAAEFRAALAAGVCDIAQPNVVRVGGITPFLRIAELAADHSVPVAPHLLPELSTQLALCVPLASMVEDIDRASLGALGALTRPSGVEVRDGHARAATAPGHGLEFATDTLTPLPGTGG